MSYTNGLDKPSDYFNTVLYTGNGGSQNITGVGFSPDWVWLKGRNNANNHNLNDKVRGVNKQLYADLNNAETTATTHLTAFDSDGFTLGNDGAVNGSSDTYVSWNWLAGGSASSNSDGSTTSSVSANTTAGFSIVSWTGTGSATTVGHGLGAVPKWIIVKNRDTARNWNVYYGDETDYLQLNDSGATIDNDNKWNDTAPTSSVFTVNTSSDVNKSGDGMIAYCFAEKKGYSKFGSYVGNSSASDGSYIDGTYVYCGFRPAFIMAKASTRSENWYIFDNKRDGRNPDNQQLYADASSAEGTTDYIDITSNGFRLVQKNFGLNSNGDTYIFMAFAESPFVTSTGIPTTAR